MGEPRWLQRESCGVRYWLTGPEGAPLLLFTHGAGADHRMFEAQGDAFKLEYRILVWDVPGHGNSRPLSGEFSIRRMAAVLIALLDQEGYDQAILVGQSMGGNISQEVRFLYPDRVAALVLIGCTRNTARLSPLDKLALRLTPLLLRLYPYERLRRDSARLSAIQPEVQRYLYECLGRLTPAEFATIFLATVSCLHEEPAYRLGCPLLLTHGAKDGTGNIRPIAPAWAADEPHCHYIVIPHAGHLANQDNPTSFNSMLSSFLAEQGLIRTL